MCRRAVPDLGSRGTFFLGQHREDQRDPRLNFISTDVWGNKTGWWGVKMPPDCMIQDGGGERGYMGRILCQPLSKKSDFFGIRQDQSLAATNLVGVPGIPLPNLPAA